MGRAKEIAFGCGARVFVGYFRQMRGRSETARIYKIDYITSLFKEEALARTSLLLERLRKAKRELPRSCSLRLGRQDIRTRHGLRPCWTLTVSVSVLDGQHDPRLLPFPCVR